jgi:hypothetical protein
MSRIAQPGAGRAMLSAVERIFPERGVCAPVSSGMVIERYEVRCSLRPLRPVFGACMAGLVIA